MVPKFGISCSYHMLSYHVELGPHGYTTLLLLITSEQLSLAWKIVLKMFTVVSLPANIVLII